MTTTATRVCATEASAQLTQALVNAAVRGQRQRCGDSEVSWMFLDENPRHRAIAATYCNGCVVWSECDAVGRYQTFGTYASKDRTRAPGKKAA
jgi:hypothetical protein